jgi:YHS domain-containing protein
MKTRMTVAVLICGMIAGLMLVGCGKEDKPASPTPEKPTVTKPADTAIEQKVCPVMGSAINKELFVDHEGRRIYFCCPACVEPFKKEPAKYIKILDEQLKKGAAPASGSDSKHSESK